jgi:hypothetical protein
MVTNKIISKIDGSFSEQNAGNYELTLLLGEGSTSWSLFDIQKQRYILLEAYGNTYKELVSMTPLLNLDFQQQRIIIESNVSTLVPELLFDPVEMDTYLIVTNDKVSKERCQYNRLSQLEIVNVFTLPEKLAHDADHLFKSSTPYHLSTVLIDGIWSGYKNRLTTARVFLYAGAEEFTLLVFDKNQLVYCNAFHYKTAEDFLYFVIFVMEQLNLNPEVVPVTLMGMVERESHLFDLVFKYIRNVGFAARDEATGYSYVFDEIPGHNYYPLLTRIL